ncbi:MAG: biotin transporter BioY [Comamonadaceae bacterium]|nr:biotin transporter BioY [Comamonadaceae bacterium]
MTTALTRRHSESIALVALFAALLGVMGLIPKIDLPLGVHISIQTLGVMLAGCLLGPWRGLQAVCVFLVAVAVGLPLLAGGRGGLGVFMAPTSGYLLGWTAAAFVTGWLMALLPKATALRAGISAFVASVVGCIAVLYVFGIAGLVWIAKIPLTQAIWANAAFIPGDLIKCVLTALVVHSIARAMPDWRLGGTAQRRMNTLN